jgi:hypothetical protein
MGLIKSYKKYSVLVAKKFLLALPLALILNGIMDIWVWYYSGFFVPSWAFGWFMVFIGIILIFSIRKI